ncbi:MAG TPA: MFS transporter [Anaerolineales bacterium]|nr:MFS transporter [Anaerolineales bacterium]
MEAIIDQKWWVLIAVGTGTFMSALDTSVVNTVLPVISRDFGTDVATIEWVVTIYLLVVSGLLLSFGRLGDMRGHKPVYLLGFLLFITGSAICGLAPSEGALIGFRGFQAIGATMLAANSPAILTKNFPAVQRGQALGLQATMTYLGLTVAPSLGGWLTDVFNWRAVFYINVPVGLLALFLSWRSIPREKKSGRQEQFDLPGAAVFMIGLVALLLALNQGHSWGWGSASILGLLLASIVMLATFVLMELRRQNPMLDLSLFRRPVFSASVASAIFNYICVFTILFLLPFYLLQGRDLTPGQAGLILTAQPIIMAIIAPISGTLSDRIGVQIPSVLGMAVLGLGLLLLSRLNGQSPTPAIILALGVAGLGTGAFISPNNSALMGSAPRQRQGIAAGVLATARSVGMVLGIGLAGAIFTTVLSQSQSAAGGAGLYAATHTSFLVAAGVAGLGVLTSSVRSLSSEKVLE